MKVFSLPMDERGDAVLGFIAFPMDERGDAILG